MAVPANPWVQLRLAVMAVHRSWNNRRAITYRDHHDISHDIGTAVVVQSMVFGNVGSPSGAGVAFTRNPVTGERALYGEFLERGQGKTWSPALPTRRRSPRPPSAPRRFSMNSPGSPRTSNSLTATRWTSSTPWNAASCTCLQVRSAKRTPEAAIRIAADMLRDGRFRPSAAVAGVSADHLRWIERPRFDQADRPSRRREPRAPSSPPALAPRLATSPAASSSTPSGRSSERRRAGSSSWRARQRARGTCTVSSPLPPS